MAYAVSDIRYEKYADQTALQRVDADMTRRIKNVHAFEYTIVFCTAKNSSLGLLDFAQ